MYNVKYCIKYILGQKSFDARWKSGFVCVILNIVLNIFGQKLYDALWKSGYVCALFTFRIKQIIVHYVLLCT